MACSTCDGYEFVPDGDDATVLVDCPDCRAKRQPVERCCVHGVPLVQGRCGRCGREAHVAAELLLEQARAVARRVPA